MPLTVEELITSAGAPPRGFWEDDLEMGLEHIVNGVNRDGYLDDWIRRRTGRQVDMLHAALDLDGDGSTRRKKKHPEIF